MPSEKFLELMRRKKLEREKLAQQPQLPPTPAQPNIPALIRKGNASVTYRVLTPEPTEKKEIIPSEEKRRRILSIKRIFYDFKELPPEELWNQMEIECLVEPLIKIKEIEIPKQNLTPQEILDYQKSWREKRKLLNLEEETKTKTELKIKSALTNRKKIFCNGCRQFVDCVSPTFEIVKRRRKKNRLVILSNCPKCSKQCKAFGGLLENS